MMGRRGGSAKDLALARSLIGVICQDLAVDGGLSNDFSGILDRDLVDDRDLARERDLPVGIALTNARHTADDLDYYSNGIANVDLDLILTLARSLASKLYLARSLACDLDLPLGPCCKVAKRLVCTLEKIAPEAEGQLARHLSACDPGRAVRTAVAIACRFVPAGHRARYSDEFRSELFELSRRSRLTYAIRLLRSAPAIRTSLRATPVTEGEIS